MNELIDEELLDELSEKQQIRLTELLDEYLQAREKGEAFDPELACKSDPELLRALQIYLSKLDLIYGIGQHQSLDQNSVDGQYNQPKSLGPFQLIRELGRGGMGIVYEAFDDLMHRKVALKLLPAAATFDAKQIARFKNESLAAGQLQHPSIVPIYNVGQSDNVHYFSMQLIDGRSAAQWIADSEGPGDQADWKSILRWFVQIADALHHAHEHGVVHRDVKPSNLMIDSQDRIWIMDFGLARFQSDITLTQSGDLVGTVRYMSPEQTTGQQALVDGRTDIYSLAATLYEMLALKPVHDADDSVSLLNQVAENQVVPIRKIRPDLPSDLEVVIGKALSLRRDDRYETAADFSLDLKRVLAGEVTIARPITWLDQISRWSSKHRTAVFSSVAAGLLALAGVATYTINLSNAKHQTDIALSRAEMNHQLAREAVDRLGSQMAELLETVPQATMVRRQLLAETLRYHQQFAAQASDDPNVREELAITFGKIGVLHKELGASARASEALRHSTQLYRELVDETVSTDQAMRRSRVQLDHSISQNNLAEGLHQQGAVVEAAEFFGKAIRTQETLLRSDGSAKFHDRVRRELATTLNNLGLLLAQTKATEQAKESYQRSLELLSTGQGTAPPDQSIELQKHVVQTNLSGLMLAENPTESITLANDALDHLSVLLKASPSSTDIASQVTSTLNTLGEAYTKVGQQDAAILAFSRAIEIGAELVRRSPAQSVFRRDLVLSHNHLGLAYSRANRVADAAETFQKAIDLHRPLADQIKNDAEVQSTMAGILNNLGFLRKQLGESRQASLLFAEAVRYQREAVKLSPEVSRYQEYLKKHENNLREMEQSS